MSEQGAVYLGKVGAAARPGAGDGLHGFRDALPGETCPAERRPMPGQGHLKAIRCKLVWTDLPFIQAHS